jgi:hypothetical protein
MPFNQHQVIIQICGIYKKSLFVCWHCLTFHMCAIQMQDDILSRAVQTYNGKNWKKIGTLYGLIHTCVRLCSNVISSSWSYFRSIITVLTSVDCLYHYCNIFKYIILNRHLKSMICIILSVLLWGELLDKKPTSYKRISQRMNIRVWTQKS